MILATLNHILKLLGGGDPEPEDRQAVVNETVLLVLSRATESDANIKPIEVETVREIVKQTTGEEVSDADVRVAARSKIFADSPLERHLSRFALHVDVPDRVKIAQALAKVILADGRVTAKEVRFFNLVAAALGLTPASLSGLFVTD